MTDPTNLNAALADRFAEAVANRVYALLKAKPPIEPLLLTAEEAGVMIGRTERAVVQMHYNGQLHGGVLLGGKLRFDKRKILAQINALQEEQCDRMTQAA